MAPIPPEIMEEMELMHFMQKVEKVLYSGNYDICKDESLKGENNEEKFKEVVFGTVISVTGTVAFFQMQFYLIFRQLQNR